MHFHFIGFLPHWSKYFLHSCGDASSALLHTAECAQTLSNSIHIASKTLLITCEDNFDEIPFPSTISDNFQIIKIDNTKKSLVNALCQIIENNKTKTNTEDILCFMHADAMFSHAPLYQKMIDLHTKYHAHYTRGEGYPEGIIPQILSSKACQMMKFSLEEEVHKEFANTQIERESLFHIIEKHINDYDIEALLAPSDMRLLRLSLCADTRSAFVLSKKLWDAGLQDPDEIDALYKNKPELFRGTPKYIYLQISTDAHKKIYAIPNNEDVSYVDEKTLDIVLSFAQFAEDAVICVGFLGEVASHKNIFDILTKLSNTYSQVYVETQGNALWNIQDLWWNDVPKNISWFIYLDAIKEETYNIISTHNGDDRYSFTNTLKFIDFLKTKTDEKNIFIQATRMQENEAELDEFCKHWEKQSLVPIIQKYNDICKKLPNKKVVDISPIKRFACRHLQRDMVIGCNGDVYMCFQDVEKQHVLGNIHDKSGEMLWELNTDNFVQQVKNKYKKICEECDEYYTCNQ